MAAMSLMFPGFFIPGLVSFLIAHLLYIALFASLAVAWAVPQDALLSLSWGLRLPAAIALAFAPIFCANLLFAERFKDVGVSTVAFAANLLGAMLGGILEYAALIVGYRALLVVTAGLYACAFAFGRDWLRAGAAARTRRLTAAS